MNWLKISGIGAELKSSAVYPLNGRLILSSSFFRVKEIDRNNSSSFELNDTSPQLIEASSQEEHNESVWAHTSVHVSPSKMFQILYDLNVRSTVCQMYSCFRLPMTTHWWASQVGPSGDSMHLHRPDSGPGRSADFQDIRLAR